MEERAGDAQPLMVKGEEFLTRLSDEIERSDRYEHPFCVLTFQPPEEAQDMSSLSPEWLESTASGLTRGCDIVTVLRNVPMLIVLLPETGISGAASVLDRLRAAIGDSDGEWEYGLFEYPQNKVQLQELMRAAA